MVAQYESCQKNGKPYFITTPEGPGFTTGNLVVRLFNCIFKKYSYNLINGSIAIRAKATDLWKSPEATTKELIAACKIIQIVQSLLEKSTMHNTMCAVFAIGRCSRTLKGLVSSIAARENESKIDTYYRLNLDQEAYIFAKKHGVPKNTSKHSLELLFTKARSKNDLELGALLIEKLADSTLLLGEMPDTFRWTMATALLQKLQKEAPSS
jgi:hypothetical protein